MTMFLNLLEGYIMCFVYAFFVFGAVAVIALVTWLYMLIFEAD
jgi:hypothetical protein